MKMENIKQQFARLYMELDLTDDQAAMIHKLQKDVNAALGLAPVSVSLLERAASLVGNPGTNISGSTDMACNEWQKDYERWRNER